MSSVLFSVVQLALLANWTETSLLESNSSKRQPPNFNICASKPGTINAGFPPRPRIDAYRSADSGSKLIYEAEEFDNIFDEQSPDVLDDESVLHSYGWNLFRRKNHEFALELRNISAGRVLTFIPALVACDQNSKLSLRLELQLLLSGNWTHNTEYQVVDTAVNEEGEIPRQLFESSGFWMPEGYPVSCLLCTEELGCPPFAFDCAVEPTDNIIRHEVQAHGSDLRLVAHLSRVGNGKARNGDAFIFKKMLSAVEHSCQLPEEKNLYDELRKSLTNYKSFYGEECYRQLAGISDD